MARITITHLENADYKVVVEEDNSSRSVHRVTVTPAHIARYAPGVSPQRLLHASFEFLLEHEPKESILSRFPLDLIEHYFPGYPPQIRARLYRP
jgi:hypothetical protein